MGSEDDGIRQLIQDLIWIVDDLASGSDTRPVKDRLDELTRRVWTEGKP